MRARATHDEFARSWSPATGAIDLDLKGEEDEPLRFR